MISGWPMSGNGAGPTSYWCYISQPLSLARDQPLMVPRDHPTGLHVTSPQGCTWPAADGARDQALATLLMVEQRVLDACRMGPRDQLMTMLVVVRDVAHTAPPD